MANKFIAEFTEDGTRKREVIEFGNVDDTQENAERILQQIWAGSLPKRTDVKIVQTVGAGTVQRVPAAPPTPSGFSPSDAALAAKAIGKLEKP